MINRHILVARPLADGLHGVAERSLVGYSPPEARMSVNPRLLLLSLPAAVLAVLLGCGGADHEYTGDNTDTGADPEDDDSDDSPEQPATGYWAVSGQLAVREGTVDISATTLSLDRDADGASCAMAVTIGTVSDDLADLPVDLVLLGAWRLRVTPDAASPCTWAAPGEVRLAFGLPSPELAPAADRAGLPLDGPYGLHLRVGDDVRLFGLAASAAQLAGEAAPVDAPPVADGDYTLYPLYALPLNP